MKVVIAKVELEIRLVSEGKEHTSLGLWILADQSAGGVCRLFVISRPERPLFL